MAALLEQVTDWWRQHPYSLHPNAQFEGFYSRFTLPSGAYLVIIPCHLIVRDASRISLVYVPQPSSGKPIHQFEIADLPIRAHHSPESFAFTTTSSSDFLLSFSGATNTTSYSLDHPNVSLHAATSDPVHWDASDSHSRPEGLLSWLPLPMHWYVHSLASNAQFSLSLPGYDLPPEDRKGTCTVHEEKNWALSFPSAHHWVLARDAASGSSLTVAGGRTVGMDAYILGLRLPKQGLHIDIRPPFAVGALGLSPFLSVERSWAERRYVIYMSDWRWRVRVEVQAPKESFFKLSEPFPDGFRENWLVQSLDAVVTVKVWKRRWNMGWEESAEERWVRCGMEFGGEYYPERG